MKRVLVFILLKISEIIAIVFLPWVLGRLFTTECSNFGYWLNGALIILIPVPCFGLLVGCVWANWEWAGRILKK